MDNEIIKGQLSIFDFLPSQSESPKTILVACEESQTVCKEFRKLGHIAYSSDIQDCSGGHPEWHIKGDCIPLLDGKCSFKTMDGKQHSIDTKWDIIIAHPPCTYLCLSGQKHCNVELYGEKALERIKKRNDAVEFFKKFVYADCDKICIENPVGIMTRIYKKPTQYVQPLQFGHPTSKRTGLWLKGLPKLIPTKIVEQEFHYSGTGRKWDKWFWESSLIQDLSERSKFRSKTFQGIAEAMAKQWGGEIYE